MRMQNAASINKGNYLLSRNDSFMHLSIAPKRAFICSHTFAITIRHNTYSNHIIVSSLFSNLACIMKIGFGLLLEVALLASSSAFHVSPPSTSTTTTRLFVATSNDKALFVDETRASVSNYYGKELSSSDDLKTNACCTAGSPPKYIQDCINNIHPEVVSKYYGCGLCLPQYPLEGAKILGTYTYTDTIMI
jgi:hypothetical protein